MIWSNRWRRGGAIRREAFGAITAGLVGQAALILSGVVFARNLGPQGRGDLALLLLLPAVVYQIGSLGLPFACAYFIAQDPDRRVAIVGPLRVFAPVQALAIAILHGAVIAIVIWTGHRGLRSAALITVAWTPALLVDDYGLAILQGQRRFLSFNLLRTLPALINAAVAASLLAIHGSNVTLVIAMLVVMMIVVSASTLVFALASSPKSVRVGGEPHLRKLIVFGAKAMLGSAYPVETFRLDQLIVALFLSASDLGLYVVALSFINLPRIISQSIGYIAYPYVAGEHNRRKQRIAIRSFFWATASITIVVVLGLEVLVPTLVPLFFGGQFAAAVPISRVLLIAAAFLSARRILAELMKGAGHPAAGSIAEFVSFAVLVPAFLLFTPSFHLVGVGIALTVSAAISLAVLICLDVANQRRSAMTAADVEAVLIEEAQGPAIV